MAGYIYFLSNPAMPGLLKIGFTMRTLRERLSELQTTAVPAAFVVEAAFRVERPTDCERLIHSALDSCRHSSDREFFRIDLRSALRQCWIHIEAALYCAESEEYIDPDPHPFPELREEEEEVIWAMMDKPRYLAADWSWIRNQLGWSENEVKLMLLDLKEKGFLAEVKHRNRQYDSTWELGHKGLRYAVWLNRDKEV